MSIPSGTEATPEPESHRAGTIDRRAYEGDLVSRLRHWRGLHIAHTGMMYDEAADEIERLRDQLARTEAALPNVTEWGYRAGWYEGTLVQIAAGHPDPKAAAEKSLARYASEQQ